jgi:hypothetical protein
MDEKQQDAELSSRGNHGVTWGVSGVEWGGMPGGGGYLAESAGRGSIEMALRRSKYLA